MRQIALPKGERVFINDQADDEGPGEGEKPTKLRHSHPGQDNGSELSLVLPELCQGLHLQRAPLSPRNTETTVQTQPSCHFWRRMLLYLAVARDVSCPGCCRVIVAEEGEGQKKMLCQGC